MNKHYYKLTILLLIATILSGELADTLRGLSMKATAIVAVAFSFSKFQKGVFFRLK